MDPGSWARLHGAAVHFPVALSVFAVLCDTVALGLWSRPVSARLVAASGYALGVSACASLPAVVSGLVLTQGNAWGHGALRWHHRFVWPAWALLVALAVWRAWPQAPPSRRGHALATAGGWVMAALMAGAGHWGGLLAQSLP